MPKKSLLKKEALHKKVFPKKSWQSNSGDSPKRSIKFAFFIIFLLLFIIILGQIFNFARTLLNPWTDRKNIAPKNYSWNGTFNINVVIHNKNISVLSFNPNEKNITLIPVPEGAYLDVASGLGAWELRSVYNLGQSLPQGGEELLKRTLSSFIGIPIDGYIELRGKLKDSEGLDLVNALKEGPLNIFSVMSDFKSDLTLWELLRLKFALSSVRFDNIKVIDLKKTEALFQDALPDGSKVYKADLIRLDSLASSLTDSKIRSEALTISIYNGTSRPLLAQKAARWIKNLGGNVIITSNTKNKFDKTYVLGKSSETLERLVQIFNSECKKGAECGKIEPRVMDELSSSRAEVNVVLGEDFYNRL